MLDLDQVESQFRATVTVKPELKRPEIRTVVVASDTTEAGAEPLLEVVRGFLLAADEEIEWRILSGDDTRNVSQMVETVTAARPDLVVAPRHMFEDEVDLPHSLGTHADMLTQAIAPPVLLIPHPRSPNFPRATEPLEKVLVVTDHIVGDDRLVSWALRFVEQQGHLHLAHIEDDLVFERYIEAISKIPDLDTEIATNKIEARLLGEARRYIEDIASELARTHPEVTIEAVVERGHTVQDHARLVRDGGVGLVVMNTKDDTQQAMHGVAYSLAVELVHIPLLML